MAFPGGGNRVPEENALGLGFTPKDKNPGPIAADFYKPGGGYPSPEEMQRGQAEWAYRQEQTPEGQDRRKAKTEADRASRRAKKLGTPFSSSRTPEEKAEAEAEFRRLQGYNYGNSRRNRPPFYTLTPAQQKRRKAKDAAARWAMKPKTPTPIPDPMPGSPYHPDSQHFMRPGMLAHREMREGLNEQMNAEGYVSNVNRKSNIQYPSPQGGPTSNASGYRFTPMGWGRPEPPPIRWDQGSGRPPQHADRPLSGVDGRTGLYPNEAPGFRPFAPAGPDNFDEGTSGAGFLEWQRQQGQPSVTAGGTNAGLELAGNYRPAQSVTDRRTAGILEEQRAAHNARQERSRKSRGIAPQFDPTIDQSTREGQNAYNRWQYEQRQNERIADRELGRERMQEMAGNRPGPSRPLTDPGWSRPVAQGRPAQSARPNMVNR